MLTDFFESTPLSWTVLFDFASYEWIWWCDECHDWIWIFPPSCVLLTMHIRRSDMVFVLWGWALKRCSSKDFTVLMTCCGYLPIISHDVCQLIPGFLVCSDVQTGIFITFSIHPTAFIKNILQFLPEWTVSLIELSFFVKNLVHIRLNSFLACQKSLLHDCS